MSIEVKVPMLPESVADATVVTWHKKPGENVKRDDNLVDLETDKVVLEVPAPADGVMGEILKQVGTVVKAGEILAHLNTDKEASMKTAKPSASTSTSTSEAESSKPVSPATENLAGPAARRSAAEQGLSLENIPGSGKSGRVTREDVLNQSQAASPASTLLPDGMKTDSNRVAMSQAASRLEKRVPMTRLRARIAERLVAAQHNAAILTTFNEIDLHKVIELRNRYKESFEKRHGTRLGFMSFFTKAVIEALKRFPAVNASIDGNDVVYHNYFDIGIAVSTERGLVVPILRDADSLSFADIEKMIANYGRKSKENQIAIEDMTGGTFTITNGGVFGSLLATPIINPPQSAILGMNKIEERAVVENGQIVIRPMMYVALSYDHRIIDGKESVNFLKTIKEFLEDPARLLIDV
ncbi:MAG: 2-oxoglutarate dehydrogenase complex dihydrolipoyllysine-residue succinyltransferase [Candidatus Aquirickettsiella gammari]|jgi:2-oxoglutarate dehydrogenase E2 component (dihydrolipoamide succinyltransferase)|uniref:Dihydrolipoyllysine-residue succinyltransferase component of 2-oxoglutarate dehydrogenase complex n=1 Tax=Candidatus Aquirickettsiella gammari TaxID=2016198 RepID=A0A370CIQ2_9COXI|nr:MAG: 2-oxoglutarate dehydrogenase complex dihydrolipoyllysine-residue succinyltransferase [Candidatus Aquirickettsiella gammari]